MDDNKLESIIFGLKETIAEKDKEIEQLNSKYKNMEINYNSVWEDYRKYEVENAEQKAEIERLKDENIEERDIHFKNLCGYKNRIAELEKQVDELKEDNERWEAVYHIGEERKYRKMFVEEWKKEYQKELDKQGEGAIAGSPDFDYVYELYLKQKAEIERLTEENIEERDIHFKNLCGYKNRIAELEKQVDELKAENTELYKEHTTLIAGSLLEKQNTVKDTAKEILEMAKANLDEHWSSGVYTIYNAIRNSYGVEVE